ncbi:hypothetical protein LCGC14_1498130 [marine sediment metagenome]|uniref:Uncharacterized protein n=1 Tax=marine sediment metagenome TaxID=412755 RepID=A0A0F9J5G5_9ZZZZ
MAINLTGKADTRDYFLGRGKLYLALLDASSLPGAYRDLGNAPSFNFSVEEENLEHFSSRAGLKVLDKRVAISKAVSIAFSLDELNHDNAGLFFGGSVSNIVNPAIAGVGADASEIIITSSSELGRAYPLLTAYDGTGLPVAFSARSIPTITEDPTGTPVDGVLDTDYEIDKDSGLMFILAGSVIFPAGSVLGWWSAADASAPATLDIMSALKASVQTYAVRYEGVNPANSSEKLILDLYSVQISADGDMPMIGDEFATMSFTGSAQENSAYGKTFDWRTNIRA